MPHVAQFLFPSDLVRQLVGIPLFSEEEPYEHHTAFVFQHSVPFLGGEDRRHNDVFRVPKTVYSLVLRKNISAPLSPLSSLSPQWHQPCPFLPTLGHPSIIRV